jgi:hypothetical protein
MARRTDNWQNWKPPFSPLSTFTRHEPFPSDELKATYIDSPTGRKPKKKNAKDYYRALRNRWDRSL